MLSWVGLKSVIMAFPSYTQLLCINADFFFIFLLQSTSQAVSLKVDQAVSILRLQEKVISSSFENVLDKSWQFHQNHFQNRD